MLDLEGNHVWGNMGVITAINDHRYRLHRPLQHSGYKHHSSVMFSIFRIHVGSKSKEHLSAVIVQVQQVGTCFFTLVPRRTKGSMVRMQ